MPIRVSFAFEGCGKESYELDDAIEAKCLALRYVH